MGKHIEFIAGITRYSCCLIALLFPVDSAHAQSAFLPLSNAVEQDYNPWLNKLDAAMHTSVKPYLVEDINACAPKDSIDALPISENKFTQTWTGRKLFKEHLVNLQGEDYSIVIDPVFELMAGSDQDASLAFNTNSRGLWLQGSIGKRFSYHATFYENQSKFPLYLDALVAKSRVVPGGARVKIVGDHYDYAWATGTIQFRLDKHFTFQFGHDKNFIGDGYRSLLLSDNAFAYPFFKIITDVWKVRYVNLFTVMQDLQKDVINDGERFRQKYGSFHYLDINLGKRVTVGVFEAVIWHGDSLGGNRGFDLGYMNPMIFYRPVEFAIGSPDNVLMGFNAKVKLSDHTLLYGQVMLDEFLLKEVRAGKGWWGNKQGFQGGFKAFDLFGVKKLYVQGEVNYVRPFTYQHRNPLGNYGHYRSALAHPLGANFSELIGLASYQYKRWSLQGKFTYATVGLDSANLNFGQNIFLSYNDRYQEYNNEVGQGVKTNIFWLEGEVSWMVNPVSRFQVFLNAAMRSVKALGETQQTILVQGGLRTRLFNRYTDF